MMPTYRVGKRRIETKHKRGQNVELELITCSCKEPTFGLQPSITPVTGYLHMVDIAGKTLIHTNLLKRLIIG